MRKVFAVILTILIITVPACADGEPTADTGDETTTTSPATTTSATDGTTTTEETTTTTEAATTTTESTTTTTTVATTTTLAGEPFDIGPADGDVVAVVGVAFDDGLNVREGPGTDQAIIATLDPTFDNIVATGNHRLLPASIWNEVTVESVTGWASSRFMAYLGVVNDDTSNLIANSFGGEIPTADTMLDLGMLVADEYTSTEPESRVTVTVAPSDTEVVIDVIGLGDDALFGLRLHVFGQEEDGVLGLKSVEVWALCGRGVTDGGLCQ